MWDDMQVIGGMACIGKAIEKGSLVAVTDGLFIRELYPNLCLACFVLECSEGNAKLIGPFQRNLGVQMRTEANLWDSWQYICHC